MSTATETARGCLSSALCSSVTKKLIVSLTGLGLSGFIVTHVAANMLLLFDHEAYNRYSHALISNKLIYFAEAGLALMFLVHAFLALQLAWENRKARGQKPYRATNKEKATNFGSRWMAQTGILTLVFLVLHIKTFKFGTYYEVTYGVGDKAETMRDLGRLVGETFQDPLYVIWYEVCLVVLFVHLRHGLSSFWQSLGLGSSRNKPAQIFGWVLAALIALGFMSQPLVLMYTGGRPL